MTVLLGHVSKIVSILLSTLSNCPNNDTIANSVAMPVYCVAKENHGGRRREGGFGSSDMP